MGQIAARIGLAMLGVLLIVPAIRQGMRSRAARRAGPSRELSVYPMSNGQGEMVSILGRLVNPPTLTAPVTGIPCLAYEVAIQRDTGPDDVGYHTLWLHGEAADLVLEYDRIREAQPGIETVTPGPGTVTVARGRLRLSSPQLFSHLSTDRTYHAIRRRPWRVDLDRIDLPADVRAEIARKQGEHWVCEGTLTTGDHLSVFQGPFPTPGPRPDPDEEYSWAPPARASAGPGCLATLAALFGFVLLIAVTCFR
jgi:hypothetical protein